MKKIILGLVAVAALASSVSAASYSQVAFIMNEEANACQKLTSANADAFISNIELETDVGGGVLVVTMADGATLFTFEDYNYCVSYLKSWNKHH